MTGRLVRSLLESEAARDLRAGRPVVIPNVRPFIETGHVGVGAPRFLGAALADTARGDRRSWWARLSGITARRRARRAARSRWCPAPCSCDTAPEAPRVD